MKIRKNTGPKAIILAITAGLFLGLLSLIRANPQIGVEATADTPQQSAPDYGQVFQSSFQPQPDDSESGSPEAESSTLRTHTRTRGS